MSADEFCDRCGTKLPVKMRGRDQVNVQCPTCQTPEPVADARVVAEVLHEQHVREFDWMKGDRWSNPLDAAECGNCQRWGRYAAAILARRVAADPKIEAVRAALDDPRWRDDVDADWLERIIRAALDGDAE